MKFVLTIAICALLVWQSDAVSCYSCTNCNPVSNSQLGSTTTCTSCQTSTNYLNNAIISVDRSCSASACITVNSSTVTDGNGILTECCSSDSCNSQTKTTGLFCYDCTDCNPAFTTPRGQDSCKICKTITNYFQDALKSVSRSCASSCYAGDYTISESRSIIECCSTSYCNGETKSLSSALYCYQCTNCNPVSLADQLASRDKTCKSCRTTITYYNFQVSNVDRACDSSCSAYETIVLGKGTRNECCTSSFCNGLTKNASIIFFNSVLLLCTLLLVVASI